MHITIFGSNGQVGQLVVKEALKRGHHVTGFVHAHNSLPPDPNLTIVQGDINNSVDVEKALQGSQAIISTLSSWKTPKHDTLTKAMQAIIPAAHKEGISRIISLTGGDARLSTDKPGFISQLSHFALGLVASGILKDGEEHLRLLQNSDLDWTVIRSPVMTKSPITSYHLRPDLAMVYQSIPRAAVAQSIVDQLEATDFIKQAPGIFRQNKKAHKLRALS